MRGQLPSSNQDVLDFAYYPGWRRREVTELTWAEVDLPGGVVRLSPSRSKTKVGGILPLSAPLRAVLQRRVEQRAAGMTRVFTRDVGTATRTSRPAPG